MMKFPYWATSIPARWHNVFSRAFILLLSSAAPFCAQMARTEAVPAARVADASASALAGVKAGITAQIAKQPAAAVRELRAVRARVPALADYIAYSLAAAEFDLGEFAATIDDLAPVWSNDPPSPLVGEAALLAARAYRELGRPAESVGVLRDRYALLAQPAGDALMAACLRAASDLSSAAVYYHRVYYQHPLSGEAEEAGSAMADLRRSLGDLYPAPSSEVVLQRADKLAQAGDFRRARTEYEALLSSARGADRETARVRLGVLEFRSYQTDTAYRYLSDLDVSGEADAERLYYMLECARRQDRDDLIRDLIKRLERYPRSPWRLRALYSAGNRSLVENRPEEYVPLYRACYESFPKEPQADYCHWKVTWNAYMQKRPETADLLREHLQTFPGSERASGALYFLGRMAEAARERDVAKEYYSEITERFPNHYYADLAQDRLSDSALFSAPESAQVRAFLKNVVWPLPPPPRKFEPTPLTQARIARARLLQSAGLVELAEAELRYGARREDQPHVLALYLAKLPGQYDTPHQALRLTKSLVPGYLSIPLEQAPASLWRLLYPMPWRTNLERNARLHQLDPFVVAGLIRQESEFNPQAVSSAQAYGLMQVLPSTGRILLKASRRRFRAAVLFRPDVNLRLGTTYLRNMYDTYSGKWELVLAAYNAGGSRVQNWLTWANYREQAEFIESIPFSETRNYVFAVLRNASIYRKLYSSEESGLLAADRVAPAIGKSSPASIGSKKAFTRHPVVKAKKKAVKRPVHRRARRSGTRRSR